MKNTIYCLIIVTFLMGAAPVHAVTRPYGSLIKASLPAVYMVSQDGKRLAFPNEATYFTWFSDFSKVETVSDLELASYQLAGNMHYYPGSRLLKLVTAPTVYAVVADGVLRPIASGAVAASIYGDNWTKLVNDLPDAFFTNYTVGTAILAASDLQPVDPKTVAASVDLNAKAVGLANVSGRIMSIAVDPSNDAVAYAGSASGGIFKTVDRGENWKPVANDLYSMHVGALAIDPQDHNVIYAGTGEIGRPNEAYGFNGIYISKDAGANWAMINYSPTGFKAISAIVIDPADSRHIYLGTDLGVYETKNFVQYEFVPGMVVNDVPVWNKVADGFIENLAMSSIDRKTLFATGSRTLLMRTKDGGATWEKLQLIDNPWFDRVTITQSSGKTVVGNVHHVWYAAIADPFMIFRSDNEGDAWHEVAKQSFDGMHNYAVAADPADADTVYTAGSNLHRSTEGGFNTALVDMTSYEIRAMAFAPSNARIVYAATDTGMQVSVNGGYTWTAKNTGLASTQWYSISIGANSDTYGAVQDHSLLKRSNGSWEQLSWNEARSVVADPVNKNVVYALSADFKGIGRSQDGGQYFSSANGNLSPGLTLGSLAGDPLDSGTLYVAAGANLYGTNDGGANWYLFGNGNSTSNIAAISVSISPRRVFVGRADGAVQTVTAFGDTTGGFVWKDIYKNAAGKPVVDIAAHNNGATAVFLAGSSDFDRVVRLTDANGIWRWEDIWINEGVWPRSVAVDQADPGTVYIGTMTGAYVSKKDSWGWLSQQVTGDLPKVEVSDIAITSGTVYFATWGRGLYSVAK